MSKRSSIRRKHGKIVESLGRESVVKRHTPIRSCIGCRQRKPKAELIRFEYPATRELCIPTDKQAGSRGFYLCPQKACLNKALKKGGFCRATSGELSISRETIKHLIGEAVTRALNIELINVLQQLGRNDNIICGIENIRKGLHNDTIKLVCMAPKALIPGGTSRRVECLRVEALEQGVFLINDIDPEELSRICHKKMIGALAIPSNRMPLQLSNKMELYQAVVSM